jgi:hypothetical protein
VFDPSFLVRLFNEKAGDANDTFDYSSRIEGFIASYAVARKPIETTLSALESESVLEVSSSPK